MVQMTKNKVNELVAWQVKARQLEASIKEVNEDIKENTESERAVKKDYSKDLKVAKWKIQDILAKLQESVDEDGLNSTVTLDDFEEKEIDIELARGEMKQANKKDKEGNED